MQEPAFPADEVHRLEVLRALRILDTKPEERFDRITRVAQRLFDVPFALISLVDADRQWFKSCQGLDATETPRSISFCGHAILSEDTFVVANALDDPRFADNPLVTGAPHIRFYAGHPLKAGDGSRLGTLCIIGSKPGDFSAEMRALLADLAGIAEEELNRQSLLEATVSIDAGHQQLQAVLESVVDGIITIDDHGIVASFNRAAGRIFGYSADEVIGRNINMLMPEPYHGEHDGYLHNYLSTGIKKIIGIGREVRGQRKDGSIFPMDLAVSEMWVGQKRMYTGIVRDNTERNLAIQTRRDDEARLAAILDNVLDGIITIDELGSIGSFNMAAEKIFGYTAAEVIGNNVKMLMPEPYHSQHDGYLHNYVSTGNKKIIGIGREVVGQRKDGSTFPMDLAVSAMRLGDKRMFTGIVRDITERVKVEQMKSEFISTVSHELRTPLTSIRGALGLIVGGVTGELPPQAKAMVDIAHKNSERLIMLVNDILDIEKIESGKMQFDMKPLELVPLVEQALEVNRAYGDQFNVSFLLEPSQSVVTVNADAGRLMQVMANLLSNAAKFSSSGGTVNVTVHCAEKKVRVSVADHGQGIPEEFRGKIFQKFSQADSSDTRKKGGTGLGLSITKAIVEQMGGEIGFESESGAGTTFFVELPEWVEQAQPSSPDLAGGGHRILICEDDRDTARLLQMMLKQGGFDSDIAYSVEEAQGLLRYKQYQAITLDIMLSGQDGISLLDELHANEATRDIPVIVVSAMAGRDGNKLESGSVVLDWLDKPIDEKRLMSALRHATRQGDHKPVILHVEDDTDIRQVLSSLVGNAAELVAAPTLAEAKAKLGAGCFDLIILDIGLPDGSGLDLLPFLNEKGLSTPVMVFSAGESSGEISRQVSAALVKARTSNEVLLATIKQLIGRI